MYISRLLTLSFLLQSSSALSQDLNKPNDLIRRQQDGNTDAISVPTPTSTDSPSTVTLSSSSTITATPSSTKSSNQALTTAKTIAQNAPAGGISMIEPSPQTTTYYKVGQQITLLWNYTSLLAPPSAINVLVSNTASTYTLTQNASLQATGSMVWDTAQYAGKQNPLLNAFYTLGVYDAGSAYTAVPRPGHLGVNGLNRPFGIYATQTAAAEAVFECVTCSAAISGQQRRTIGFVLGMVGLTVMSFTYFSYGFLG